MPRHPQQPREAMLTQIDTPTVDTVLEQERLSIIKAVHDSFYPHAHDEPDHGGDTEKNTLDARHPAEKPSNTIFYYPDENGGEKVEYELLNVVRLKENLAVVKISRTQMDTHGGRTHKTASSPLLVIAKSGGVWEMVGQPLPLHNLR